MLYWYLIKRRRRKAASFHLYTVGVTYVCYIPSYSRVKQKLFFFFFFTLLILNRRIYYFENFASRFVCVEWFASRCNLTRVSFLSVISCSGSVPVRVSPWQISSGALSLRKLLFISICRVWEKNGDPRRPSYSLNICYLFLPPYHSHALRHTCAWKKDQKPHNVLADMFTCVK